MLRNKFLAIIFVVAFTASAFAEYVPGQLLVRFKPGVMVSKGVGTFSVEESSINSSSIKALNSKYKIKNFSTFAKKEKKTKKLRSGKTVELPDLSNIVLIEIPTNEDVLKAVEDYKNDPNVEDASTNNIYKLYDHPIDPDYVGDPEQYPNQWGLFKIFCLPLGSPESAWNIEKGTSEVKVVVLDSGINYNHLELFDRVNTFEGYDFVNGDPDANDDFGHGTHVAGIIGAKTDNPGIGIYNRGIAGVDWNCRLIPIKVFDSFGSSSDSLIMQGLILAISIEADVINMSFGPSDPSQSGYNSDTALVMAAAVTADCVLVAAAGNDNISSPAKYPASYDGVIAVAATGPFDTKASYSNYGAWIDVSAPGGQPIVNPIYPLGFRYEIFSTYISSNDKYTAKSGTSMATPYVVGEAALLRAKYPSLTAEAIADLIRFYVDDIDPLNPNFDGEIGSGRINAYLALGGLYGNICSPPKNSIIYGVTQIRGTATGEGFVKYSVEYGKGVAPTSWITLEPGSSVPKVNGKLAVIDTTGLSGALTIKLRLNDLATMEKTFNVTAGSPDSPIIFGRAEYGPNPFDPKKQQMMIKYDLSNNSEVHIYFYNINGNVILRKYYSAGSQGGAQGTNRVWLDGKDDFGDMLSNGVYLFRVVSEDRTIGKGKIIVLKSR